MNDDEEEAMNVEEPLVTDDDLDSICEVWPTPLTMTQPLLSSAQQQQQQQQQQRRRQSTTTTTTVFATVATLVFSLPALIGSWCWPILLAGMFSGVATEASKSLAHSVSFAVNLTVTTNLLQYVHQRSRANGNARQRGIPVFLIAVAIPFVMLDNLRHVLQDGDMLGEWSRMYRNGCLYGANARCLSVVGWTCLLSTYVGFVLLMSGVLMSAGVFPKIKKVYREIRDGLYFPEGRY